MLSDAYCHGIKDMHCFGDSQFTIKYMNGEYNVQNKNLVYFVNACSTLNRLI